MPIRDWGNGEFQAHGQGEHSVPIKGRLLKRGDSVTISRPGWRGRIGKYLSFDRKRNLLKIQFAENGGALLLCRKEEILLMDFRY